MSEAVTDRSSAQFLCSRYLRVSGVIVCGAILIATLAGITLVILPISFGGGNGAQLAAIAAPGVLAASCVLGIGVGLGAAILGSVFGVLAVLVSKIVVVERAALAVGAAVGSIPTAFLVASIMGWDFAFVALGVASTSAMGSLVAHILVKRRFRVHQGLTTCQPSK